MGAVFFYHLTRDSAAGTLTTLLPKALAAGMRVEIRGTDADMLDRLDQQLWLGPEEGFLPHGRAGGVHDALQPILLTLAESVDATTSCLMCVGGAPVDPAEVSGLDRACVLFDGDDPAALDQARGQWKALTGAGCAAQYWSQDSGRWEKKAES
ncbi:MAG: DNA polymerase III subunit chi [Rhodobacteraceae bacterium]|nr:DNA polymerase III subunit chi [Paracoccaceae bacterium]